MRDVQEREQIKKDMIDIITKNPGIGSAVLARMVSEATGMKIPNASYILSDLAEHHKIIRLRTHERGITEDNKEVGYYSCWVEAPLHAKPEDFIPIKRPGKEKKIRDAAKAAKAARVARVVTSSSITPEAPRIKPENGELKSELKMKMKPGTFFFNLMMPNGSNAAFTLDEARRIYEQLYRLFGANGL